MTDQAFKARDRIWKGTEREIEIDHQDQEQTSTRIEQTAGS